MAIVRLDKVQAIYNGNIESVRHTADMPNGSVVALGELENALEGEVRKVKLVPEAQLENEEILLVATPELMPEGYLALKDFKNKANKTARAYHLVAGDIVTLTDDLIDGATKVDEYVVPQANSLKLKASADGKSGAVDPRLVFKVIAKEALGYDGAPATVIQVVRA